MSSWQLQQTSQAPRHRLNWRSALHEGIRVWFCNSGQQPMLREVIYLSWEFSTVVNKTDIASNCLSKINTRITEKLLSVVTRKPALPWVVVEKVSVPQQLRVSDSWGLVLRQAIIVGGDPNFFQILLLDPLLALLSLWSIPTKMRAFVYFKALSLPVPARQPQFVLDMVVYKLAAPRLTEPECPLIRKTGSSATIICVVI